MRSLILITTDYVILSSLKKTYLKEENLRNQRDP